MQLKWLPFWSNQNFSIRHHAEKQNKKLNVRRVFFKWKISKNIAICKHLSLEVISEELFYTPKVTKTTLLDLSA